MTVEKLQVGNPKAIVLPSNLFLSFHLQSRQKRIKLASQLPAVEFVIETFGNTCTLFNPNTSCLRKYTELQFTDHGKLYRIKTLDYYLKQNRVAVIPSGECNFHIFYYLVSGASPEEGQHLHL